MAVETGTVVFSERGGKDEIEHGAAFQPAFDATGLIPAIAVDSKTGTVLMFAWMNAEALKATLASREAHFWSRSRAKLWKKGEESGNVLKVVEVQTDCDQDVVVLRVEVAGDGVACHTGAPSCFYRTVDLDTVGKGAVRLMPVAGGHPRGTDSR